MSKEMFGIEKVLNSSQYISSESIQFWYPEFHQDCCTSNVKTYCQDPLNPFSDSSCYEGKLAPFESILTPFESILTLFESVLTPF